MPAVSDTGETASLRQALARIEGFDQAVRVIERALPAESEGDFEDVRAWRVQIEHSLCLIWLVTEASFVSVTLHDSGAYDIEMIPTRQVRQVIENCRDGVVGVTIEVDAGPTNHAGQLLGEDPDTSAAGVLARSSHFQYVAAEPLGDPSVDTPLQFFARAMRLVLSSTY